MASYYTPATQYGQVNAADPSTLSFYSSSSSTPTASSRLDSIPTGTIGASATPTRSSGGGEIVVANWWNAFTPWTGQSDDVEPPLLDELGIQFDHIWDKSRTVLNPFTQVDPHIMDDADLAGPLVFCFVFACFLLLSGKPQFSYIYGVALVGSVSMYCLLNLMSPTGIDAYRTASVLGYCILPLVLLSMVNVVLNLEYVVILFFLA
ncbi:hypothetical protein JCM10212_000528 [Sporobolomyces blumeae]